MVLGLASLAATDDQMADNRDPILSRNRMNGYPAAPPERLH